VLAARPAMSDVYLPPPPPRSPGSGSLPQRRVPGQPLISTTAGFGFQQGQVGIQEGIGPSSYAYSPQASAHTPLSPYAPAIHSPLSRSNSRGNSPIALRHHIGSAMAAEYNPQQWGSGPVAGVQHRPFNSRTIQVASRALDDSGGRLILICPLK